MEHLIRSGYILPCDASTVLVLGKHLDGSVEHLASLCMLGWELFLADFLNLTLSDVLFLGLECWTRVETVTQSLHMGQGLGDVGHHATTVDVLVSII